MVALELGKGQEHVQGQTTHGCRRIELLGDRDKGDVMGIEIVAPSWDRSKLRTRSCLVVRLRELEARAAFLTIVVSGGKSATGGSLAVYV
jgi:hypothetical protein